MQKQGNDLIYIGKYIVQGILGQGGEGRVYLARDCELNRLVAMKRFTGEEDVALGEAGKEVAEQIKKEASFLQSLSHPMLPTVYDLLWDGTWYLVMEYIQGRNLHDYIKTNGMAREEQARIWAGQLLDILQYLHTRKPPVIYQDLKPENIMVCPDGNLKLVDFGAAYCRNYSTDMTGRRAVSAGYAAPEQLPGEGRGITTDERSDIYAFGRVMYYVLTGADPAYPPYAELPIASYAPEIGVNWERVLRKCMEEIPMKRYQVVEEIWDDLSESRVRNRNRDRVGAGERVKKRDRVRTEERVKKRDRDKVIGVRGKKGRFIRKIEKRVYLTEKKSSGLMVL